MSYIHKSSATCTKSELDLMLTPPTQASIISGRWTDYYPVSVLDGDGPIEFKVSGSAEEYIAGSQIYLYTEVCVKDANGADLTGTSKVGPVNNFQQSMFSQLDITLNDILVTSSVNTYAYRSMFETLLNYGEDSKQTHLASGLFYKDTAGEMETLELDKTNPIRNEGWLKRREIMGESKTIDMYGKLHADIFFQDRYILNNVEMKIRLSRNSSNFCLIGDNTMRGCKIVIQKAILYVRKVKINPEIILAHATVMEKTTAKYPIRRVETKIVTISKGMSNHIQDNISTGALPSRVVFGMVESTAYNGAINKNPFNFRHFDLNKIGFAIDGEDCPYKAIELDFSRDKYILGYYSLFTGIDRAITETGNFIERTDYPKGYTLFAFDFTGDLCSGDHFNLVRNGNLRLKLDFDNPLTDSVCCIVYMEYQNLIEINKNRQIVFDYSI